VSGYTVIDCFSDIFSVALTCVDFAIRTEPWLTSHFQAPSESDRADAGINGRLAQTRLRLQLQRGLGLLPPTSMPVFPKLFKRHRTTSTIDTGPSSYNFPQGAPEKQYSLPVPIPDLRRGISLPQLVVPQNGFPVDLSVPHEQSEVANGHPPAPSWNPPAVNGHLQVPPIPINSKMLPAPPEPSPAPSPVQAEASDELGGMWRGINDRGANISKSEKVLNKISDTAGASHVLFRPEKY
jgi:hypothetical protein